MCDACFWGVAKWPKAPDFDSGIRRFESSRPSQPPLCIIAQSFIPPSLPPVARRQRRPYRFREITSCP